MKHNRKLSNLQYLYPARQRRQCNSVPQCQEKQNKRQSVFYQPNQTKVDVQSIGVPKGKLSNGNQIPLIGFGTWKIPAAQTTDTIYQAIKTGYRHIDCAPIYGNEKQVGLGIKNAIQDGIVKRQQLFITSKLWSSFHRPQNVKIGFQKSMKDLGLQYIDLYLMHNSIALKYVPIEEQYPIFWYSKMQGKVHQDDVPAVQTYKAMQNLVKQGLAKAIGVSNFNVMLLRQLYNSVQIKPAVVQNELHPYLNQQVFVKFCKSKNIHVTSYSTLGGASYIELQMANQKDRITKHPVIEEIADLHRKTPTQVILKWAIQQQISVIPKTINVCHMKQNISIIGWQLTPLQIKRINQLNKNKRFLDLKALIQSMSGDFVPFFE